MRLVQLLAERSGDAKQFAEQLAELVGNTDKEDAVGYQEDLEKTAWGQPCIRRYRPTNSNPAPWHSCPRP